MEVNTNLVSLYDNYSILSFTIQCDSPFSSDLSFQDENLDCKVDGNSLSIDYQDEIVYMIPMEETSPKSYILELLELPLKRWILNQDTNLIQIIEELKDKEIVSLFGSNQEVVVDGPGSSIVEYQLLGNKLIKKSLQNIDSNVEDRYALFQDAAEMEEFNL